MIVTGRVWCILSFLGIMLDSFGPWYHNIFLAIVEEL
jgi:hypothetical protein